MSEERAELGTGGTPIAGAAGSLALRDIPIPDYCDVVIVPTGGVEESDPRVWAEAIFAHENTPLGSRGLRALRDEAVRLFDMVPPPQKEFVADEVVGSEALIVDDDDKLAVRIGVALLPGGDLLQVTTAVKYKTVRGRLAFAPRRLMHAAAVNTLARRAPTTLRRRALTGDRRAASLTSQVSRRALGRGPSSNR
ncbi:MULTISPECIES: hypothetical protein [Brachybacterium]|uniref:hypothetical protein n=1 Tax=Brachybacterium TaxID=43668 RepID=UPI0006B55446|nr:MULTISPECIES: hypothetical protein [Brachybacterium]GAP78366.1 hypothetical protein Y09_1187 [Brachybacterium sp. SW0106-09]